jgi:hypothetical protein
MTFVLHRVGQLEQTRGAIRIENASPLGKVLCGV